MKSFYIKAKPTEYDEFDLRAKSMKSARLWNTKKYEFIQIRQLSILVDISEYGQTHIVYY